MQTEFEKYYRMVFKLVNRNYHWVSENGAIISREDLIQCGFTGLLIGINKFDTRKPDCKKTTFLWAYARREINRYLSNNVNLIRIPEKWSIVISRYMKKDGITRESKLKIIEEIGIDRNTLDLVLEMIYNIQTLEDIKSKYIHDGFEKVELEREILSYLLPLSRREKRIIVLRYGLFGYQPHTLEDVSKKENISKMWVSVLEKKALEKIKKTLKRGEDNANRSVF